MSSPKRDDASALAELRSLPRPGMEPGAEERVRRSARAAFDRAFEDVSAPPHVRLARALARAAMPVLLAGVVGVYLTWAITTASALVR